jgi:chemosensory pili system protein ChpA (sensor histidine kinase/response regulator)
MSAIDSLEGAFRADMDRVLAELDGAFQALASPQDCMCEAGEIALKGLSSVRVAGDACHALDGCAATVGADGLVAAATTCTALLAELREALEDLADAAARIHRTQAAAVGMVPALNGILALELARDRAGADAAATALARQTAVAIIGLDEREKDSPISGEWLAQAALEHDVPVEDGYAFSLESETGVLVPPAAEALSAPLEAPAWTFDDGGEVPVVAETPGASWPGAFTLDPALLDPEVQAAFAAEAGELLDALDQRVLAVEARGSFSEEDLAEWFRLAHTFKGAATTVGRTELGAYTHRLEDVLDDLRSGAAARPPLRALADVLLHASAALRHALMPGAAAPERDGLEALILRLTRKEPELSPVVSSPAAAVEMMDVKVEADKADAELVVPHLRVPAERLDRLMDHAGELVQARSRITSRMGTLSGLQRELGTSRRRLGDAVEAFRSQAEFAGLEGGRVAMRFAGSSAATAANEDLSALELDRYEDLHVLSRALGEIGNDVAEVTGQIGRQLGAIAEDADALARAVGDLQSGVAEARLVPLAQLATRLRLAVRDAAARMNRQVRLEVEGTSGAIDKALVDGLAEPLMHLVRNAVAHGVELPAQRRSAGKPEEGVIRLIARQEGGQLVLVLADDGAGLDLAALRQRGVMLGLVSPEIALDHPTIRDLIFAPGISTAGLGAVAGRGVGCDAARRAIQRLGGSLMVSSEAGRGTAFTIALPLSMAIARALLLRQGGRTFAVPMVFVERVVQLDGHADVRTAGVSRLLHEGRQVPVVDLGEALAMAPCQRPDPATVVLRLGERRRAIAVDGLLAQTDVVVGGLGELLDGHPLFLGATLTGDGELVPILDVVGLLEGAAVSSAPTPRRSEVVGASGPAKATRRRVLFVDDSLSVRLVAGRLLSALGVEPVLAVDGEDALVRLRAGGADLVITDLEMPRRNGFELLRELHATRPDLPVVVASSRSGDKHRRLAVAEGAKDFLGKPFTQEQLTALLTRWLPA